MEKNSLYKARGSIILMLCIVLLTPFLMAIDNAIYAQWNTYSSGAEVSNAEWKAQTFKVGHTGNNGPMNVSIISVYAQRDAANPNPGLLTTRIYAVDADNKPTGSALAYNSTNAQAWATANAWHNLTMVGVGILQNDTNYTIVQNASGLRALWGNGAGYTYGNAFNSVDGGSTWTGFTGDFDFYVFGDPNFQFTLNSPANSTLRNDGVTFNCSATLPGGFLNLTLFIDGVQDITVYNTTANQEDLSLQKTYDVYSIGSHNYTCQAQSYTLNSMSDAESFTLDFATINSENYSSTTVEGSVESFSINITYNTTEYTNIQARLWYNGTFYTGTQSASGSSTTFSRNITTPIVSVNTNIPFRWEITLNNGTDNYMNYTQHTQTVNNIAIDDCSTYSIVLLNLTLVDEVNQALINYTLYNSTIEVDVDIFAVGGTNPIIEYSQNWTNNTAQVCLQSSLGSTEYELDTQIRYDGDGYSSEFYHIQGFDLNNDTLNQNIILYDLKDANTQKFQLIARDSSYLPVKGGLIKIERKYIEEGTFNTVEIPKTDDKGITSASLEVNDVIYNFYIYNSAGTLISSFTNVLAICQTPLVSQCEIDFNAFESEYDVVNYETVDDLNFTIEYNKTSRVVSSRFVVLSGEPATMQLIVTKEDALGTSICSDSLTSASGTLSCTVGNSFGNSSIVAEIYKDGVRYGRGSIRTEQNPSDIFGIVLVFLGVLVMMTLIGLGISDNPVITGLFLFVGVLLLLGMNLIEGGGFVGATATILFLGIAIVLVIVKASRRS